MELPRTNAQKVSLRLQSLSDTCSLLPKISKWRMPCPRKCSNVCLMASLLWRQVQVWSSSNREKRYSKDIISLSSALCTQQFGLFPTAQVPWQWQLHICPLFFCFPLHILEGLIWKLSCRGRQAKGAICSFNCQAVEDRGREGVDLDGSCPDKQQMSEELILENYTMKIEKKIENRP